MLRKALIITTVSFFPISSAFAGAIDFRVGSDVAEINYLTQTASFGYGGADMGFGALINDNSDFMVSGSILVSGSDAGDVRGLHFGVGAKAYAGSIDGPSNTVFDATGGAVAIGGGIRYVFPGSTPLAILGEAFYAPDVTSISDFTGIKEYRVALELEVTPSARAYIGYKQLKIELDNDQSYKMDDEAHIGIRFEF